MAGRLQDGAQILEAGGGEGRVGLLRRPEVLFDPEMDPEGPPLEPAAAPDLEFGGFGTRGMPSRPS